MRQNMPCPPNADQIDHTLFAEFREFPQGNIKKRQGGFSRLKL
jgi:hypothetical protein